MSEPVDTRPAGLDEQQSARASALHIAREVLQATSEHSRPVEVTQLLRVAEWIMAGGAVEVDVKPHPTWRPPHGVREGLPGIARSIPGNVSH